MELNMKVIILYLVSALLVTIFLFGASYSHGNQPLFIMFLILGIIAVIIFIIALILEKKSKKKD